MSTAQLSEFRASLEFSALPRDSVSGAKSLFIAWIGSTLAICSRQSMLGPFVNPGLDSPPPRIDTCHERREMIRDHCRQWAREFLLWGFV